MAQVEIKGTTYGSDTCELSSLGHNGETDCQVALQNKCRTAKAFSVLGILAIMAACFLVAAPVPWPAACGAAGFASFSYMLIFSIYAAIFNGDKGTESDCGNGNSEEVRGLVPISRGWYRMMTMHMHSGRKDDCLAGRWHVTASIMSRYFAATQRRVAPATCTVPTP